MHRVVVSDTKDPDLTVEREVLDIEGITVERHVCHDEESLLEAAAGADALVVDAGTPVTARVLRELDLRVVARAGTGVDNIDREAAREVGTVVTNVPDYSVEEVSTHALALVLDLARGVTRYDRDVRAGNWDWEVARPLGRLRDRTLGVVAVGNIGRRAAEKAAPFFGEVVGYDPYLDDETLRERGVEPVDFAGLIAESDAISVHAPLTAETEGLFDAAAFEAMSEGTLFVNTGRGGLVEEDALLAALSDGTVAGAGLDVLREEPPTDRRLVDHDRVVVTPHAGWYSEESSDEVRRRAARAVKQALVGEVPDDALEEA
jgi:D-3-phosphoglycerate dehydrogenase